MNKFKFILHGIYEHISDFVLFILGFIDDRPVLKSVLLFLFAFIRYLISIAIILFVISRFFDIINLPPDTVFNIGIMTAILSYLTLFLFYDPF